MRPEHPTVRDVAEFVESALNSGLPNGLVRGLVAYDQLSKKIHVCPRESVLKLLSLDEHTGRAVRVIAHEFEQIHGHQRV